MTTLDNIDSMVREVGDDWVIFHKKVKKLNSHSLGVAITRELHELGYEYDDEIYICIKRKE